MGVVGSTDINYELYKSKVEKYKATGISSLLAAFSFIGIGITGYIAVDAYSGLIFAGIIGIIQIIHVALHFVFLSALQSYNVNWKIFNIHRYFGIIGNAGELLFCGLSLLSATTSPEAFSSEAIAYSMGFVILFSFLACLGYIYCSPKSLKKYFTQDTLSKEEIILEDEIKNLGNKNPKIRLEACKNLGIIKDKKAVEPLLETLKDRKAIVRIAAAESLAEIGATEAIDNLQIIANTTTNYSEKMKINDAIDGLKEIKFNKMAQKIKEENGKS